MNKDCVTPVHAASRKDTYRGTTNSPVTWAKSDSKLQIKGVLIRRRSPAGFQTAAKGGADLAKDSKLQVKGVQAFGTPVTCCLESLPVPGNNGRVRVDQLLPCTSGQQSTPSQEPLLHGCKGQ